MKIGLNLKVPEAVEFSKSFQSTDIVYTHSNDYGVLSGLSNVSRMLSLTPDILPGYVETLYNEKISNIAFNLEGSSLDLPELVAKQKRMYDQVIELIGMKLVFVPSGQSLVRWPSSLSKYCHALCFQTQKYQIESPEHYIDIIKMTINMIHINRPSLPVWVQVSVSPPTKHNTPIPKIISTIQSIFSNNVNAAGIYLHYLPEDWQKAEIILSSLLVSRARQNS